MAICPDCKQEMLTAASCTLKWVRIEGKWYRRSSECYAEIGHRCGDCLVIHTGNETHHQGCDNERCPKCGGQFLGCGCKIEYFATKKPSKEDLERDLARAESQLQDLGPGSHPEQEGLTKYIMYIKKELAEKFQLQA
jgi:hypothetical protein